MKYESVLINIYVQNERKRMKLQISLYLSVFPKFSALSIPVYSAFLFFFL